MCRRVALARDLREAFGDRLNVGRLCVESRADGGAAHVDRVEIVEDELDAPHGASYGGGVCAHLLSERDGDSILEMRTTHLQNVTVLF